jgi:hypothetical protein
MYYSMARLPVLRLETKQGRPAGVIGNDSSDKRLNGLLHLPKYTYFSHSALLAGLHPQRRSLLIVWCPSATLSSMVVISIMTITSRCLEAPGAGLPGLAQSLAEKTFNLACCCRLCRC